MLLLRTEILPEGPEWGIVLLEGKLRVVRFSIAGPCESAGLTNIIKAWIGTVQVLAELREPEAFGQNEVRQRAEYLASSGNSSLPTAGSPFLPSRRNVSDRDSASTTLLRYGWFRESVDSG